MYKIINTKETVLDKNKLKEHLKKFASDNIIKETSDLKTYPIPRVLENYEYIYLVYTLLNKHIKLEIPIHPAGEWLLDNFYLIENMVRIIQKDLKEKQYKSLPGIANGNYEGFARIFVLANEIVVNTDGNINEEEIKEYIQSYQTQKNLTMKEIWNLGLFLQICILEKIREITEQIFISQMQKFNVENVIERILENKDREKLKINVDLYQYIEYMSYKLRTYGEKSNKYLEILEEEVQKGGLTINEVINKVHYNIAVKTVSMKNCITSIKTVLRINILDIFENVSIVESILKKDKIYNDMDYETKEMYRKEIQNLAEVTKLSEVYIAQKALELTKEKEGKKGHIGYYIISKGKNELIYLLTNKKRYDISNETKVNLYIYTIYFFTILFTILVMTKSFIIGILSFIPIQCVVTKLVQYIFSKIVKPKKLPKMDFEEKQIPEKYTTMCVIPVLIKNENDVQENMKKLEVYYLANKSKNIYFTLLGDCTAEKNEKKEIDKIIIKKGKELVEELNKKYEPIFNFVYRKREWSSSERLYMGWERKRGLLTQFNEYLLTGKNIFLENTCNNLPKIKYIITLDSDTKLVLNTAKKLIGCMSHILNNPEINKITNTVVDGHALIQPRIGVNILDERKSIFTRLFAGSGGIDLYANAISDIYQDNFEEGIYTGKGIYDLEVFSEVLKNTIPENTTLSHDLLEGSYLRCGLASDIVLMDGYPSHYLAYKNRKHRWIRGDVQVLPFLNSTLNKLSKYKILDNIVRDTKEIFIFFMIIISLIMSIISGKWQIGYTIIAVILLAFPTIIEIIEYIFGNKNIDKQKLIVEKFSALKASFLRFIIKLMILPDIAYLEINAVVKSIYRMYISHNNLLEWTTAEQAEKNKKEKILDYYLDMKLNILFGIIFFLSTNGIFMFIGALWIIAPYVMCMISKNINKNSQKYLNKEDKDFLIEKAKMTWQYFKDNTINGLPSDNYQEDRKDKISKITSPTNIGLGLIAIISSYDLKFENLEDTIKRLEKSIETIEMLPKWNGHLYNWYNIDTLQIVKPMYISSVDSGNFVGYLYTVKQFLLNKKINKIDLANRVNLLIEQTDFSKLYNEKIGLLSIGYDVEQNIVTDSYYDLLATEARQASLVAIAKKDVKAKHWNNLSRTLTKIGQYKGLVSWGGTAFEYLMPTINIPSYETTLLDESCRFSILSQKKYAKKLGVPWGISESAFNIRDIKGNYQYKTFGIPWLGLKRGLEEEVVISPYSTVMSLAFYTKEAIENLKQLEKVGAIGKYGFYESIDYKLKKEVVKTFMAHHQGLILTSINNIINENVFQKRFMENPEIEGINILLEERMPENVIITKEKKEKVEKIKYKDYEGIVERNAGINILANEKYAIVMKDDGSSYSKYGNSVITDNNHIYIKDVKSKKIYDTIGDISKITFTPSKNKIILQDGNLIISLMVTIVPNLPIEIREIQIKNIGNTELTLELTSYMDMLLTSFNAYDSHVAFNKMFLEYEKIENGILVTRRKRDNNEQKIYVATTLYFEDSDLEYEIDKEKFIIRGNKGIPDAVENSWQLSNKIGITIHPIVAMRRIIKVKPQQSKKAYLINSASDTKQEAENNLKEYIKSENLNRVFDISKSNLEAEMRYLGLKGSTFNIYQEMLKHLIYPEKKSNNFEKDFSNQKLWKYGISGDNPILLLKIKDKNDMYLVNEVLKAKEFFNIKNILVDIVIITEENLEIQNVNVISNIIREDKKIIEERANLIIDSRLGNLNNQIKLSENKIKNNKKENKNEIKLSEQNKLENKNLLYYNGYGGFSKDGKQYHIMWNKTRKTPAVWCNIMANENFGSVVTESLGGYTWYKNSKMNRLTKFSNDSLLDIPSEKITLEEDNKYFEFGTNGVNVYVTYGFGYAKYEQKCEEIEEELTIFVPVKDSLKINILNIKNTGMNKKNIKIIYDIDFQMGEKSDRFINYILKENLNILLIKNNLNPQYYSYISSNEKIALEDNKIVINIDIDSLETKSISLLLGCEENEIKCIETISKYLENEKEELENVKKYWEEKTKIIEVKTPLDSFNIMQNGWLIYQTMVSRMLGKTGFYQSGGAYGYRDQLQDAMGMKYIDSDILKNQIILHSKHQFIEGDVEHWWHDDSGLGIRARYSDDLLWLPYAVINYIEFTGDYSILEENTNYVQGKLLEENEHDYMDIYLPSEKIESIYEHCMRAINKSLSFDRFPKMQGGDWNDGMNKVGEKGIGESIWLGFFLYSILVKFAEYSKYVVKSNNKEVSIASNNTNVKYICEENNEYNRLMQIAEKLRKNLNNDAWDGRWFKRAITDDGKAMGSVNNKECKIDALSQSWSVISNAGDNDKKYIAMESVDNYLVDRENNLIKLLTPSFKNEEFKPGYISAYAEGMRENGGQYTHSAIWCAIANSMLNMPEKVFEMYKMINPIEHSKTEKEAFKYKVEPYVVSADIYSMDNLAGRGGWTWYTGSSSWLYTLQTEYMLGLKINEGILKIKPCFPKEWDSIKVKLRWKNSVYNIVYTKNKEEKEGIITKLDGKNVEEIKLQKNGSYNIDVFY